MHAEAVASPLLSLSRGLGALALAAVSETAKAMPPAGGGVKHVRA